MNTTAPTRSRLIGVALTLLVASPMALLPACSGNVSDRNIEPIAQSEVAERLASESGSTLVLDARDRESYEAGRLPGARRTTLSEIDLMADRPRFGSWDSIIVYGRDPGSARAPALVKRLLQHGKKNVALLEGGYDAWVRAGLPVER